MEIIQVSQEIGTSVKVYDISQDGNHQQDRQQEIACTSVKVYDISQDGNHRQDRQQEIACTSVKVYDISQDGNHQQDRQQEMYVHRSRCTTLVRMEIISRRQTTRDSMYIGQGVRH